MTTNLHDKMLAAIDAYFSASDAVEEELAENLLLDVRDEIRKQPAQQAPVAWGIIASNTGRICQVELDANEVDGHNPKHIVPLYTTPQAQPRGEATLAREPLTDEKNRKLFAAFVKKNLGDIAVMDGGRYISPKINNYWLVWQEARCITKGNT